MKLGVADAAIAPQWLTRWSQTLAVAGGASSLWVPDHLINALPRSLWKREYNGITAIVPRADAFLEPSTLLGWLAAKNRLTRLQLGTSVTDAGRRNPAVTAQAFATLHLLTKGRAVLGIGTGERENNVPYGVPWERPVSRFEEAVSVIRDLWSSDGRPVTRAGRFFPLQDAVFDVPPYRGTRPPIWIAAHGPRMLEITGRLGDGWMPAWPQTAKVYGERLQTIRDAAENAGRADHHIVASGWFFVFTGPTKGIVDDLLDSPLARALALTIPGEEWSRYGGEHPCGADFSGLQDLLPHLLDEQTVLDYGRRVPDGLLRESFFTGTPNEIVERFAEYRDQGLEHPILLNAAPYVRFLKGAPSHACLVQIMRQMRRL
jgi:phthiodiolone/phenolphthiodiolone dimycocerosates ketoreductase